MIKFSGKYEVEIPLCQHIKLYYTNNHPIVFTDLIDILTNRIKIPTTLH